MPFVYDDLPRVCFDKGTLISMLQEKELLGDFGSICEKCLKGKVYLRNDKSYSSLDLYRNDSCNKKTSIREGSWFSGTHLLLEQAIKLTYYWVYKTPSEFVLRELRIGSEHTIENWYNFAREVCIAIRPKQNSCVSGSLPEKNRVGTGRLYFFFFFFFFFFFR